MPAPATRAEELAAALETVLAAAGSIPMSDDAADWIAIYAAIRDILAALADGYALRPDPYTPPPLDPSIARLVGR